MPIENNTEKVILSKQNNRDGNIGIPKRYMVGKVLYS
jgi:hypothetical protein